MSGVGRGRAIAMVVIGTIFVALGVLIWFVDPQSWPLAAAAVLFFGACVGVGVLELLGGRVSTVVRARMMGLISMPMGLGCGALALIAWDDPRVIDRAPPAVTVAFGLIGLVFFGGGGLLLLIRGGRPFGVDRADYRRRNRR
ncbi:hypothetical protein [Ornithinimicrobium murale]|uniref:hypothetical protein n=1 Tax=Ornithinimicrobium murale TaxID=1050153 RepID=UPI000E0D4E0F|nr:hypothetical protein [Ornithinimicrobium murale]